MYGGRHQSAGQRRSTGGGRTTERVAQGKSGFYLWDFDFGGGAVGFKVEARQLQEKGAVGDVPPPTRSAKAEVAILFGLK